MRALLASVGGFFAFLWRSTLTYIAGIDPGMVKAILLKLVRHSLTATGPLLAAKGWLGQSDLALYIGSAEFVTGFVMSVLDAYMVRAKIKNAIVVGRAETGKTPQKDAAVAALKDTVKT